MQKTVYITDELGEGLERHKQAINVSAILQEGLQREIRRLELASSQDTTAEEIVDRLRTEKRAWEDKWYEAGVSLGGEWARQARYESLKWAAEHWHKQRRAKWPNLPSQDPVKKVLAEVFGSSFVEPDELVGSEIFERYPTIGQFFGYDDEHDYAYARNYDERAVARGWADAVLAFWESVKSELA